jgi:hypothetical protein
LLRFLLWTCLKRESSTPIPPARIVLLLKVSLVLIPTHSVLPVMGMNPRSPFQLCIQFSVERPQQCSTCIKPPNTTRFPQHNDQIMASSLPTHNVPSQYEPDPYNDNWNLFAIFVALLILIMLFVASSFMGETRSNWLFAILGGVPLMFFFLSMVYHVVRGSEVWREGNDVDLWTRQSDPESRERREGVLGRWSAV